MQILSLFDGMACGMLAMQAAGITVDRYVAYEYDETTANAKKGRPYGFAVLTSSHNFPMIEHRGDVFKGDFTEFFGFDFVIGGSPCTFWSIAQKNGRETEASGIGWELFCQYARAVREAKPRWFIYENNKSMSKAIRKSIDETFGFEAVEINSKLVSAQNRQRLYWVGKRNADGTYSKVNVELPEDRGILLKDILESGCGPVNVTADGKAQCVRASSYKDGIRNLVGNDIDKRTAVAEPVGIGYRGRMDNGKWVKQYECNGEEKANALTTAQTDSMVAEPVKVGEVGNGGQGYRVYSVEGKSVAQTATSGGIGSNTGLYAVPVRVGTYPNNAKNQEKHDSQQYRIYSTEGKSVNLCGNGGGMGAKTGLYAVPAEASCGYAIPCEWDEKGRPIKAISCADGKVYTVYEVKDGKITIKGKTYPIKLKDGFYIIRKLTVRECMRLQTVPEWYEFPVSDTQAYRQLGNGWTVQVIAHLIEATQKENCAPVYTWHTGAQLSGQMSFDELFLFA